MHGAITGDTTGSRFELVNKQRTRNFDLFNANCCFTDDAVVIGLTRYGKKNT